MPWGTWPPSLRRFGERRNRKKAILYVSVCVCVCVGLWLLVAYWVPACWVGVPHHGWLSWHGFEPHCLGLLGLGVHWWPGFHKMGCKMELWLLGACWQPCMAAPCGPFSSHCHVLWQVHIHPHNPMWVAWLGSWLWGCGGAAKACISSTKFSSGKAQIWGIGLCIPVYCGPKTVILHPIPVAT